MKKYKYNRKISFDGKLYNIRADTLEELGRKKAEKLHELRSARSAGRTDITLKDWAAKCVDAYKQGQSDDTRKKYTARLKTCILSHLGHLRLKDVTPLQCQQVLNLQAGKSRTQINETYNTLRFLFRHAVANDLIAKDPTVGLVKPKGTHRPRRALSELERETLIAVASKERKYYCFLLMLYCGCRPSEACRARRSDVFVGDNGLPMLHIRGTKTGNAERDVPMPIGLYKLIKDLPKKELISVYPSGTEITTDKRGRLWHGLWYKMNVEAGTQTYRSRLIEPYVIPKDLTPYCLRHEYCTELGRLGVDLRVAQKLMGHSDIALTANIYTHIDSRDIDRVAELMGET